jgi:hypothetical protein
MPCDPEFNVQGSLFRTLNVPVDAHARFSWTGAPACRYWFLAQTAQLAAAGVMPVPPDAR